MTHNTRAERALIAAYEAWTADSLDRTLEAIAEAVKEPPARKRLPVGCGHPCGPLLTGQDAIDATNDHARDLRKHGG